MAIAGIDTHKDTLAVAVVDEQGRALGDLSVENAPTGYERLLAWLIEHGVTRTGIEGSGSYGRNIALWLQRADQHVVEVPPQLTAQARRRQRSRTKSAPIDALLIARITLRDVDLPAIRPDGALEDLRLLVHHRRELRVEQTRIANRLHADLAQLSPGYQRRIGRLSDMRNLDRARRLLAGDVRVRARIARKRILRLRTLARQLEELTVEIRRLGGSFKTSLTTIPGVAELSAAELLAEIGEISRYRTKAQFAMANGTAPLAASSGRTDRHRLNRGGNRQLNRIIHYIALTQTRDGAGRAYYEQKKAEGKNRREALRCLKRRISDRIFNTLRTQVVACVDT